MTTETTQWYREYCAVKGAHPDHIVLFYRAAYHGMIFRGAEYWAVGDDAEVVYRELKPADETVIEWRWYKVARLVQVNNIVKNIAVMQVSLNELGDVTEKLVSRGYGVVAYASQTAQPKPSPLLSGDQMVRVMRAVDKSNGSPVDYSDEVQP